MKLLLYTFIIIGKHIVNINRGKKRVFVHETVKMSEKRAKKTIFPVPRNS